MKRYWLFLFLWGLPCWLYAHELDNFLQGLRTLHAQFEQILYNEKGEELEKSQGKMYVQRPNKFHWEYKKPYTQLLVADGKKVWIYDKDLEQVTVKTLDKTVGKTPAFLLSSNRDIKEDFFVNRLPTSSQAHSTRFELVPKDAQAQFDSMRISVRGKILLGFELVDHLGQTTYITFTQVRRNKKLKPELFIFTPPAGVDTISENN